MTSVGLRWEELLLPLLQKYKLNITWGDQDLLNIIFHYNPGKTIERPIHQHTNHTLSVAYRTPSVALCLTEMCVSFSQNPCLSFPVSGTIAQITASMAATVLQLKRMASTYYMETEGFTTTTNNRLLELFTRP